MAKKILFEILNFEYWKLFVSWGLVFVAYPKPPF
jgi:hypothetical protein